MITLANDRPVLLQGGYGPIPYTSLDRFAARHNLNGEDFDTFCYIVAQLDQTCIAHLNSGLKG